MGTLVVSGQRWDKIINWSDGESPDFALPKGRSALDGNAQQNYQPPSMITRKTPSNHHPIPPFWW